MVGSTNQVFRRRLLVASCLMATCPTCLDHLTMFAKPVLEPLSLAGIAEFIKSGRCSAGFFFEHSKHVPKKTFQLCHTIPKFPWAIFPNKFLHHFLNSFPKLCPIHHPQTLSESYPQHFPPSSSPNSNIFLTIFPYFSNHESSESSPNVRSPQFFQTVFCPHNFSAIISMLRGSP